MKNFILPFIELLLVAAIAAGCRESSSFSVSSNGDGVSAQLIEDAGIDPSALDLRVYPVPPQFRSEYVQLLSQLVSTHFDEGPSTDEEPSGAEAADESITSETVTAEISAIEDEEPPSRVSFDAERRTISVLANELDHRKIDRFLNELEKTQFHRSNATCRIVFAKRNMDPKLKHYPYEFNVEGKSWGDGRLRSRYPKWLDNRSSKYPSIWFYDLDVDKEDKETEFKIQGYVKKKEDAASFFDGLEKNPDTQYETRWTEHDFITESTTLLQDDFGPVYTDQNLSPLIRSLQRMDIYNVQVVTVLIGETSVPGFYRSEMDDGFSLAIRMKDGFNRDGSFQVETALHKERDSRDEPFDEENLRFATSLLTRFGQVNLVSLHEHDDKRYVLVILMEEGKLQPATKP